MAVACRNVHRLSQSSSINSNRAVQTVTGDSVYSRLRTNKERKVEYTRTCSLEGASSATFSHRRAFSSFLFAILLLSAKVACGGVVPLILHIVDQFTCVSNPIPITPSNKIQTNPYFMLYLYSVPVDSYSAATVLSNYAPLTDFLSKNPPACAFFASPTVNAPSYWIYYVGSPPNIVNYTFNYSVVVRYIINTSIYSNIYVVPVPIVFIVQNFITNTPLAINSGVIVNGSYSVGGVANFIKSSERYILVLQKTDVTLLTGTQEYTSISFSFTSTSNPITQSTPTTTNIPFVLGTVILWDRNRRQYIYSFNGSLNTTLKVQFNVYTPFFTSSSYTLSPTSTFEVQAGLGTSGTISINVSFLP